MEVDEAFDLIAHAIDTGNVANGYILVGNLEGGLNELVKRVLIKLFPNDEERIEKRVHPDIFYLEPQGASRTIKVERGKTDDGPGMRDGIIEPMSVSSFSGGWKVGVIVGADRMQPAAANAFLKILEEPPAKTIFLLLTDQPDSILPTVVSRSQRIDLGIGEDVYEGETLEAIADAFENKDAISLTAVFKELKDEVENTEVAQVRKRFFKTLMSFVRPFIGSGKIPAYRAFENVAAIEDAFRQSDRSMSDDAVISYMLDRIVFP